MKKSILLILSFFLAVTLSAQDISSALRQAQARFESGNEAFLFGVRHKLVTRSDGADYAVCAYCGADLFKGFNCFFINDYCIKTAVKFQCCR